jgi:TolB protein
MTAITMSTRRNRFPGHAAAMIALALLAIALAPARVVSAPLTIEIIGGGGNQIPITVLPLEGEDRFIQRISQVVSADLQRSGMFRLGSIGSVRPFPKEPSEINYRYWRNEGAETLVLGSVSERSDGRVEVRFRMMDVARQSQLLGFSYTVSVPQLRVTAHKIADMIYEKLTGDPGVFATKICFVTKNDNRFELQVADSDGYNADFILAHREPIISCSCTTCSTAPARWWPITPAPTPRPPGRRTAASWRWC